MFNIRYRLGGYPVLNTSITVHVASIDKAIDPGKEIFIHRKRRRAVPG